MAWMVIHTTTTIPKYKRNAPYCSADGDCFACNKDADCVPFCGTQAACIRRQACADDGVVTACVGPVANGCTFPDR